MKYFNKVIERNIVIFQNLTYITLLELFISISPLITYPYLVKTLGSELYGLVIMAQVVASYAIIVVNFGFRRITARDIAINRNDKQKLSEIVSAILVIRCVLWIFSLLIYSIVVFSVPVYNSEKFLFLLSFGLTFSDLLFPQFYFHGIEKMKFITLINIGVNAIFIVLIFFFVQTKEDYYFVPLFKSIGFLLGGLISLYIMFYKHGLNLFAPKLSVLIRYVRDALPIFSTEIIASIKDKFSYILLGSFVGMHEVLIYDLGSKFTVILTKPATILSRVLLPKISKERNVKLFEKSAYLVFLLTSIGVITMNLFLPWIVEFFIHQKTDLMALRVFLLAPVLLALSSFISTNGIIAFGHNKYVFYSIIITTISYVLLTLVFFGADLLNSTMTFIVIAVISYLTELVYRLYVSNRIMKYEIGKLNSI